MNTEPMEEQRQVFLVEEKEFEYERRRGIDIVLFTGAVLEFFSVADRKIKQAAIEKIFASCDWYVHHTDKRTGRCVYSESSHSIEYKHELRTAIFLTQVGYDVLFAPKGMFAWQDKKFDVFLIKGTVMLKADLKAISSSYPNTISIRIKGGSDQASRVVLHILSDISPRALIDALQTGCYKNPNLIEIFLVYRNCFYRLPKNLITSKRIFEAIKK